MRYPGSWTSRVVGTTCWRTRTTSSWTSGMWRCSSPDSTSSSRGSLAWIMGAWPGSGFTCSPTRCSTRITGCLSILPGENEALCVCVCVCRVSALFHYCGLEVSCPGLRGKWVGTLITHNKFTRALLVVWSLIWSYKLLTSSTKPAVLSIWDCPFKAKTLLGPSWSGVLGLLFSFGNAKSEGTISLQLGYQH